MGFGANMLDMATGGIVGGMTQAFNNRANLKQAGRLQKMQIQGQKEMGQFNNQMAIDMWNATGYGAQKQQMKDAGINPALMYGMGGGGAQSSNIAAGNVSGYAAPTSKGSEVQDGMGMMMQMRLLDAQAKNLEATANNQQAQADITNGVENQKRKEESSNIAKDSLKKVAETALIKAQERIANITADVSEATKKEQIDKIRAEAIGAVLQNGLTRAKTKLTGEQTESENSKQAVMAKEVNLLTEKITSEINQRLNDNRRVTIEEQRNNISEGISNWQRTQGDRALDLKEQQQLVDAIMDIVTDLTPKTVIHQK